MKRGDTRRRQTLAGLRRLHKQGQREHTEVRASLSSPTEELKRGQTSRQLFPFDISHFATPARRGGVSCC